MHYWLCCSLVGFDEGISSNNWDNESALLDFGVDDVGKFKGLWVTSANVLRIKCSPCPSSKELRSTSLASILSEVLSCWIGEDTEVGTFFPPKAPRKSVLWLQVDLAGSILGVLVLVLFTSIIELGGMEANNFSGEGVVNEKSPADPRTLSNSLIKLKFDEFWFWCLKSWWWWSSLEDDDGEINPTWLEDKGELGMLVPWRGSLWTLGGPEGGRLCTPPGAKTCWLKVTWVESVTGSIVAIDIIEVGAVVTTDSTISSIDCWKMYL